MKSYLRVLAARRKKWDKRVGNNNTISTTPSPSRRLKNYIRLVNININCFWFRTILKKEMICKMGAQRNDTYA